MLNINEIVSQLKSLRRNSSSHHDKNEPGDIWDKDCEALDYAIQAVIEKQERKALWISATEKLPETNKCVLLSTLYHTLPDGQGEYERVTVGFLHQPSDKRYKPYFYWAGVSDYGDMVRATSMCPGNEFVTHWMPLPEPWEG